MVKSGNYAMLGVCRVMAYLNETSDQRYSELIGVYNQYKPNWHPKAIELIESREWADLYEMLKPLPSEVTSFSNS